MPKLKLIVWNMEWMNDLFVAGNGPAEFRRDEEKPFHNQNSTVRGRRTDLAGVINDLAPDVVVAVEAPSRPEELGLFFDLDVAGDWRVGLQVSPGQSQNIGIAIRTDTGRFADEPLKLCDTREDSSFDPFLEDTDNDGIKEQHRFERRPLYAEVTPKEGRPFRVLGLHLKSKGIFNAYEWSKWWETADANRKKLLAQTGRIRAGFLDPYLKGDETREIPLIVCGDINDGPGMDACEKRLLGSAVERLMGRIWNPELCLGNALFDSLNAKDKEELDFSSIYTTSFRDPIFNNVYQQEWIDHILYSKCRGGEWVTGGAVNQKMPDGVPIWKKYPHASDHFPVSVDVSV
jgi:endonuclease/exonuclease/phosphatase family metal-dependent hydrolase